LEQIVLEAMDLLGDCTQQKLVPRPESPFLAAVEVEVRGVGTTQALPGSGAALSL
jgi:hypothetical protein